MTEPIDCACGHAWRQHNDIGQCGVDFRIGAELLPCLCEQYRAESRPMDSHHAEIED